MSLDSGKADSHHRRIATCGNASALGTRRGLDGHHASRLYCCSLLDSRSRIDGRMAFVPKTRLAFLLGIFGIVIVIGVMNEEWQTIDKHFPALNRFLHSGTPTTQSDVEYVLAHLDSDAERLNALCMKDTSGLNGEKDVIRYMADCRAQTLAARPLLDDLHVRFQQFKAGWEKETTERSVPTPCRNVVDRVITSFEHYLSGEDTEFKLWESLDPNSATGQERAQILRRLADLDQGGAAATLDELKGIDEKLIRDACKGY